MFNKHAILIVDDDPVVLNVLSKMLQKLGHSAETALDGKEAISLLTGKTYTLVITDFNMPLINGGELASWIKQHHPRTKVVIMTGFASGEAAALKPTGLIDDVILKPVGLQELQGLISGLNLVDHCEDTPLSNKLPLGYRRLR